MTSFANVSINVDPKLCVYCGLCEIFCPFNAIKVYVNDKPLVSTLKNGVLPRILRKIEVDLETCLRVNALCEKLCIDACPMSIIRFNGSCVQVNDNEFVQHAACARILASHYTSLYINFSHVA